MLRSTWEHNHKFVETDTACGCKECDLSFRWDEMDVQCGQMWIDRVWGDKTGYKSTICTKYKGFNQEKIRELAQNEYDKKPKEKIEWKYIFGAGDTCKCGQFLWLFSIPIIPRILGHTYSWGVNFGIGKCPKCKRIIFFIGKVY